MKAVDTNLLVHFLVKDDEAQSEKVFELFYKAEQNNETYFVSTLVLLELVWVLKAVYGHSQSDIVRAIEGLNAMPVLMIEKSDAIYKALQASKKGNYDLSDLLIAYCSVSDNCDSVFTFDKNAAKHPLFELF